MKKHEKHDEFVNKKHTKMKQKCHSCVVFVCV